MTQPEVAKFPDGHFQCMIWALGPYIADYPEKVLLTCIVQGWCARYVFISYTWSIMWCLHLQGVEHHQTNSTTVKMYMSDDHVITQTFLPQNVKWGFYMIIMELSEISLYCHSSDYRRFVLIWLFTNEFPQADIHELIAPDLLHQVVKGVFKDYLVAWVEELLLEMHTGNHKKAKVNWILNDIDHQWVLSSM